MHIKLFAGVALATFLAACSAATLQTNLAAINSDLSTFNANLNADIATISAQGLPVLCQTASVLNAGFNDLAPLSAKLQGNQPTEKAVYAQVSAVCAAPPTDAATLAAAVIAVAANVKLLQSAAAPAAATAPAVPATAPAAAPAS